jgi:hypothetical protein
MAKFLLRHNACTVEWTLNEIQWCTSVLSAVDLGGFQYTSKDVSLYEITFGNVRIIFYINTVIITSTLLLIHQDHKNEKHCLS